MLLCQYCKKECKNENSLRNHERLCKDNPNKQPHPRGTLGKSGWNKGLTAETDIRVFANRESLRKQKKKMVLVGQEENIQKKLKI